jgi:hypothetical protein
MEVIGQHHAPAAYLPGKNRIGSCIDHRAGLEFCAEEKDLFQLPGFEILII